MRAVDVYRVLLLCYPAPFRQEYGDEMASAFGEQLHDARRGPGRIAAAAVWIRTLVELLPTAFREHRHVIKQDIRHAIRIFAAHPGFTAVAVLSLALGIGANAAIFSLLNSVAFRALPVKDPQALVILSDPDASGLALGMESGDRSLITYQEFRQLQDRAGTFAALMASQSRPTTTEARVDGGKPEDLTWSLVSSSYFATLGVAPLAGRTFDAAREAAEGTAPQAVISYEYWQRRFGGAKDVLGKPIVVGTTVLSVIGVMPRSFFGETVGQRPDAWVPLAMQTALMPGRDWLHDRPGSVEKAMWLHVFGRLRPGVTRDKAQADANVVFQQGLTAYYGSIANEQMRKGYLEQRLVVRDAATGASSLRSSFAEPLTVLLAAAALVLLIACANLGNMLLARTMARTREMSVRLALGASRRRVVRQLLTESLTLAAAGGIAGLGAAFLVRQGLVRLVPDSVALPAGFDLRTAGFVVALTLAAGLLLGLLPALRITRADAVVGLRDQGRGIAGSAAWLRLGRLVVVGQLALSLPLLVGAGLLVRTLANLQRVDLGYAKDDVITVRVDAKPAGYDTARQTAAFDAVLARIRALPGVGAATYSNNGLFDGGDNGDAIDVEGYTATGDGDRGSRYDAVGPGYFSTLGIPVLLGREITDQDRVGGQQVCVINKTFATRFFGNRSPIGLHVTQHYAEDSHEYEVVGVVADSRQNRLRGPVEHRFYTPVAQPAAAVESVSFIVRPRGDVSSALASVRRVIHEREPTMEITREAVLTDSVDRRLVQDRLLAKLSIAFGIVAGLLAAIGLYGVLSYGVARRTSEIGIRKALGAADGALVLMIVRETGWLLVAGLVAGGALSIAASKLITSRLYGLTPTDPSTITGAVVALAVVALLATWLPARRASRVDPIEALRCE